MLVDNAVFTRAVGDFRLAVTLIGAFLERQLWAKNKSRDTSSAPVTSASQAAYTAILVCVAPISARMTSAIPAIWTSVSA